MYVPHDPTAAQLILPLAKTFKPAQQPYPGHEPRPNRTLIALISDQPDDCIIYYVCTYTQSVPLPFPISLIVTRRTTCGFDTLHRPFADTDVPKKRNQKKTQKKKKKPINDLLKKIRTPGRAVKPSKLPVRTPSHITSRRRKKCVSLPIQPMMANRIVTLSALPSLSDSETRLPREVILESAKIKQAFAPAALSTFFSLGLEFGARFPFQRLKACPYWIAARCCGAALEEEKGVCTVIQMVP